MSDMARLTVRLSDVELLSLKRDADAAGKPVSVLVRERLGLSASEIDEWREEIERRVSALEELAGR